jgi:SAM-dependent methyltransferase
MSDIIGEENGLSVEHNSRMLIELENVLEKNIEGEIADIGCWQGTISFLIAQILKKRNIEKTIYLFDTFDGHILSQIKDVDKNWSFINNLPYFKTKNIVDSIKNKFEQIGYTNYKIVQGDVLKTFELDYPQFCFASLDLNFYEPTMSAIKFMEKHISPGGIIIEDDYENIDGITQAFNGQKNIQIVNRFSPGASFKFVNN